MNYFDLVLIANNGFRPFGAPDNGLIDLNSNTLFWQRKKLQEVIEVDLYGNFARFAVYRYRYHGSILMALGNSV
jgi:hypothetical protein